MRSAAALLALLAACASPDAPPCPSAEAEAFAARMVAAHGGPRWYATSGLRADLTVDLRGERVLEGAMLFEPASGRCRIDLAGGGTIVFDGEAAWATAGVSGARFHALTWPYFLGVPWKLADDGALLVCEGRRELDGRSWPTASLTFGAGAGDTPEDEYVLFADPATGRLAALAYTVTYGRSVEEARASPSLALYRGYRDVDGLLLPRELTLYFWSEEGGLAEPPKGRATFERLRVVTAGPRAFERPPGARADELPDANR